MGESPISLLYVYPSDSQRGTVGSLLHSADFEVTEVRAGSVPFVQLPTRPDLALIDGQTPPVMLPEIVRELRSVAPATPLLLLSTSMPITPVVETLIRAPGGIPKRRESGQGDAGAGSIMDQLLEGCQIIGQDWRYIYLNDAAAAQGRRTKSDLLGKRMMDAYPGIEKTPLFAALRRCMEERIPHRMENEFSYPDGSTAWFELNIRPVPQGVFVLSIDRSAAKLAELALRESEEKYRSLFENSFDGLLLTVPDGKILAANGVACALFQRTEEEIRLLGREGIVDRGDPRVEILLREREQKGRASGELTMIRKDGSSFPAEVRSALFETRSGVKSSMLIRDVSDEKRTLHDLEESRNALRALARSQLTVREEERAAIARELHDDLGQILTALKIDVANLRRELRRAGPAGNAPSIEAHMQELTRIIDEGTKSVRRVIQALRPEILDSLGLVPAIEWMCADFAHRNGIPCAFTVGSPIPPLPSEHITAVFRIFQEILTNVSRHANATRVESSLRRSGRSLLLVVEDNGRGFDVRASGTTGSLGLLGIKERAQTLHGAAIVESERGGGVRVTIQVPLPRESGGDGDDPPLPR